MEEQNLQDEREKLRQLIIREAYFKEKVTLSSGKKSDYYIDARLVTLNPLGAYLCSRQILDMIKDETFDAIGGPTLGADPLIGAIGVLSLEDGNPLNTFIIRREAKVHGKQRQIEGPELRKDARVIIIDDVATTGGALLHSLDVLRKAEVNVVKAICVVDRNEGAKEALAEKGCELISLFDISEIHQ